MKKDINLPLTVKNSICVTPFKKIRMVLAGNG